MGNEASISWGAIGTAIGTLLILLREFGVNISEGQENAILKAAVVALPIIVGLIIRGFVYSRKSVQTKVDEAHKQGAQGTAAPAKML